MHTSLSTLILYILAAIMNFEQVITAPSIHPNCANLAEDCDPNIPCCTPYICQMINSSIGLCVECFGLGVDCQFNHDCCSNRCHNHACTIVPPQI
ncbi:unnamed protein product [Schistosoma turkestanicum]|nr:unnamed protein product [Schistosoma turkestanicum]